MMQQMLKMWLKFLCPLGPFSLAQSHMYSYSAIVLIALQASYSSYRDIGYLNFNVMCKNYPAI